MVYAAHNGTAEIHIIDISDPVNPREVGRWGLAQENKRLHDVIVQEGYAYLSYWNDGIITLDAGAGTHGGTAATPTLVSQFEYPVPNNTHTAWRHGGICSSAMKSIRPIGPAMPIGESMLAATSTCSI